MLPTNPLLNATAPAGPHLPTATLRQYAAGTLAPAAQHRVEAHTLACPRCADILAGLLQTTPATTDQALAKLQQRLRHRAQQTPAALPATRTRHRHRLMVLQLAAAATLLFGLVAGGWWTWQQRHASPTTAAHPVTPRAAASVAEVPSPAVGVAASPAGTVASAVVVARAARPVAARPVTRQPRASTQPARQTTAAKLVTAAPAAPVATVPAPADTAAGMAAETAMVPMRAFSLRAPAPAASRAAAYDSATRPSLAGRLPGVAVQAPALAAPAPARVRLDAMPAAPVIPPTPVVGYAAWREKLRHDAAEYKPEAPDTPLSGSVQLRVTIGADGKVQEIRVLHGLRADYNEEAQRLVCDGPGWAPGIGGGKRAAQSVDVTVPFQ